MQAQQERLRKTQRNLKRIETSAIPGVDKLITGIKGAKHRNTVILARVIAFCVVTIMWLQGYYLSEQSD